MILTLEMRLITPRYKTFLIYLLFLFIFSQNVRATNLNSNKTNDSINILEKGLIEQNVLYGVIATVEDKNDIGICEEQLLRIKDGIRRKELWALKMIDASGQENMGYMYGNGEMMGWRSHCDEISNKQYYITVEENQNKNTAIPPFQLKFVSAYLKHQNPVQIQFGLPANRFFQLGLCMPKQCTNNEVSNLLNKLVEARNLTFFQKFPVQLSLLEVKSPSIENIKLWELPSSYLTFAICVIAIGFSLVGSYVDENNWPVTSKGKEKLNLVESSQNNNMIDDKTIETTTDKEKPFWLRLLKCFSIPTNIRSLFNTKLAADAMPAIHGIKALGMVYILMVHRPIFSASVLSNLALVNRYMDQLHFVIIKKCHFSVDTYFCLGGFLISYTFCKAYVGKKTLNFIKSIGLFFSMIAHRLVKMLPVYSVMILVSITLWRIIGNSNPIFERQFSNENACRKYWWRNLLFISTWYYRWDEHCLMWTWYLSNDMQFYILNCIVLIIGLRYLKFTEHIVKVIIAYGIIYTAWVSYKIQHRATIDRIGGEVIMYYAPFTRIAPYFVGVIAGIYFYKWNGKLPFDQKQLRKGWLLFAIGMLFTIFSLSDPDQASFEYTAIICGITRPIWAACMAWLVMCCLSGNAGIVGKFLSHPCWVPMSRASFSVYLSNLMICYVMVFTADTFEYSSMFKELFAMGGNAVLCYLCGFSITLLFESPLSQIIKLLSSKSGKKVKEVARKESLQMKTTTEINEDKEYIVRKMRTNGLKH